MVLNTFEALIILILFFLFETIYFFLMYFSFFGKKENEKKAFTYEKKISVVIAARNEAENIGFLLEKLSKQRDKNFEVIVVCDRCTDKTAEIVKKFSSFFDLNCLEVLTKKDSDDGKKNALKLGFEAAKGDIILLTDADCVPFSDEWLTYMCADIRAGVAQVVVGVSPMLRENFLLNHFVCYETLKTASEYITATFLGFSNMCVGRNWAFEKQVFDAIGGFGDLMQHTGGDDDLLLQKFNGNLTKINFCVHEKSFVCTKSKQNLKDWYYQKIRHLGAGKNYGWKEKIYVNIPNFLAFIFYLQVFFVSLHSKSYMVIFFVLALRIALRTWVLRQISKKMCMSLHILEIVLFEFIFWIYFVFIGLSSFFKVQKKWN